jgi:hypothetical protein
VSLVRLALAGAAVAAIAAAAAPEVSRRPKSAPAESEVLAAARDFLEAARARLADDPRPDYLLGSAALLAGEPAEAILRFRDSLRIEERPETDLSLSRAHRLAGDPEDAATDALRAVWLSPPLVHDLPTEARRPVRGIIADLEKNLSAGDADAIPKLATSDAPPGEDHR